MKFTKSLFGLTVLCLGVLLNTTSTYAEDSTELYIEANNAAGNTVQLTPEQQAVLDNMPALEEEYLNYGESAPVKFDTKNVLRARTGAWTWRDGVICVTTEGVGTRRINTWHAAIVAPQVFYSVAEAPGVNEKVRYRTGEWTSSTHTIWQVGVSSTSIDQDWVAGNWAGNQVGKPYNLNFWNSRQTDSFYCAQLVWAAYYYTAGVDLNKSDNDLGSAIAIHPGELVNNPKTTIIYRNK